METQKYIVMPSGAKLIILERGEVTCIALDTHPEWKMGRAVPNTILDIPLRSSIVSREHGSFAYINNKWYFTDNPKSLNGTFYNGKKIENENGHKTPILLEDGDILRIDNFDLDNPNEDGVFILFTTSTKIDGQWVAYSLKRKKSITIGRTGGNDIVVPVAHLSAIHAKITSNDGKYYLSDCESMAGTYLNGERVTSRVLLKEKDCFSLCDRDFIFTGESLLYIKRDPVKEKEVFKDIPTINRPVILDAKIESKSVKIGDTKALLQKGLNQLVGKTDTEVKTSKVLIRDINLQIRKGTLVALLGGSGAGKSTLMNCLNGMETSGVEGSVLFDGNDLIKNFEAQKHRIGSVPQEKTFHENLTPEEEFRKAAVYRLPDDTSKEEIEERVNQVLVDLKLEKGRKTPNSQMSGGEKTRINIGIELVADRELLFLDEPDQGLDPETKRELFTILKKLAKSGKSIICIIHDVAEIDMFDQMIVLAKVDNVGRLAFSGTPETARKHFEVDDIRKVYKRIEKEPREYVKKFEEKRNAN